MLLRKSDEEFMIYVKSLCEPETNKRGSSLILVNE